MSVAPISATDPNEQPEDASPPDSLSNPSSVDESSIPVPSILEENTVLPWDTQSDTVERQSGKLKRSALPPRSEQSATSDISIFTYGVLGKRLAWLAIPAFLLGGIGEAMLFSDSTRLQGVILLLVAALVGVLGWHGARDLSLMHSRPGALWRSITWRPVLLARLVGVVAGAGLAVASIRAYMADPSAIFGLQGVLWLASMAVLAVSCAGWYTKRDAETTPEPAWTRQEIAILAGILVVSLVTHLALLDQIPWRLHFDEDFAYQEIMRYYRGPAIPLFTTTWVDTTLPSMWFIVAAAFMRLTGPTLAGVRLGVAVVGALTVLPVYGIGRLVWGRLGGALAAFAVAVSAAYVHYSRTSIINITTPFFWAICFYFLLRGLRSRRPGDFVWGGIAAGLSMYTYYGTRLLPYVLALFFAYLLVFHFRAFRERIAHLGLFLVAFVAGFGPLLGYFMLHPELWNSRAFNRLNVPPIIPTSLDALVSDWNILAPLVGRNFLGLSVVPSGDTQYYGTLLLAPEAMLLVLGAGLLIWRWRQPASFLILLWSVSTVLTGGTLLDKDSIPNLTHWTPSFPAFYLALALPAALFFRTLFAVPRRAIKVVGVVLLALMLGADLGGNTYFYLVQYPARVPPDHSLEALQGRFLARLPANTHMRIIGKTWVYSPHNRTIAEMMALPGTGYSFLFSPSRELPLAGDPAHNLAFILYNDMYSYLPVLQSYYPGGISAQENTPDGTMMAQSYVVLAQTALQQYGVLFSMDHEPQGATHKVPSVGALPPDLSVSYPFTATWTGSFAVDAAVPIQLSVQGAPGAAISVLGEQVSPDSVFAVEPGWVPFSVTARLDAPSPVHFFLQQGSEQPVEPVTTQLWPTPPGQGLAVTLGSGAVGPTHRIDPFVGATLGSPPRGTDAETDAEAEPLGSATGGSAQIRWEGEFNAPLSGQYNLNLRSDTSAELTVGGASTVKLCPAPGNNEASQSSSNVSLTAGWHKVRIDYTARAGRNGLEWSWTLPDGTSSIVPPDVLRTGSPGSLIHWPDLPAPVACGP